MTYAEADFQSLVRSVVYQQLNGKVAAVIFSRLSTVVGGAVVPDAILALTAEDVKVIGLSRQKAAYLRDLAARTDAIDFPCLPNLTDQEVIERLTQVKGIGTWTAHMFLMFALRRPDVLPTGDLAIRMAVRNVYGLAELPKAVELEAIARNWRPWCSVASWYLWRSLELPKS